MVYGKSAGADEASKMVGLLRKKWNFDGYICLSYSLLWGILGTFCLHYGNEYFTILYKLLPGLLAKILVWVIFGVEALDAVVSYAALFHNQKKMPEKVQDFDRELRRWTKRLGEWVCAHMETRIEKAYPTVGGEKTLEEEEQGFAKVAVFISSSGSFPSGLSWEIWWRRCSAVILWAVG